jgi:DHA1 family inner membrane transport protein
VIVLTTRRKTLALIALALGGFGIGSTEFVAMGLLPNIAQDLLPGLYARSSDEGIAQAADPRRTAPRPSRRCRRTCRRRSC